MTESIFHAEIFYYGHVQGVGFRYQVLHIACQFEVAGYVRNTEDGAVLVEAEGGENAVLAFKKEIEDQMRVFIRRVEFRSDNRPPHFAGFTISS